MHSVPITIPGAPHNFTLTYIHSFLFYKIWKTFNEIQLTKNKIFLISVVASFSQFTTTASHPSDRDKPPENGRAVWKKKNMQKWLCETQSSTYTSEFSTTSYLSALQPPSSSLICPRPTSHHPTNQPTNQPNLGQRRTRPPLIKIENCTIEIRQRNSTRKEWKWK